MADVINLHEAKTHLSRLVEQAVRGQDIVIGKAGKPLVRLVPLQPPGAERRLGFLAGQATLGADLKKDFAADIESMFPAPPRR